METSELEMTPPDSPKATKEKRDAPAPEEDLLADLFPTAPPRDGVGNRTTNDILCKPELEQAEAAGVVALHYTLDKPPADWPHFTGFVDAPMLEKTMPPPGPDTYIFCCGPPPMIKSAIAKLEALGHDPSHVLCF